MGILEQLGIEPGILLVNFTGFLLLVWLLRRYAFGPLADIMYKREQQIRAELADAEHQRQRAEQERKRVSDQLAQIEERGQQMIADARKSAEEAHNKMLEEARRHSERIIADGKRAVEQSAEEARRALREETAKLAADISARLIRESLDEQRQAALVDAFVEDVRQRASEQGAKS